MLYVVWSDLISFKGSHIVNSNMCSTDINQPTCRTVHIDRQEKRLWFSYIVNEIHLKKRNKKHCHQ